MRSRRTRALELLKSPYFFPAFLEAVGRAGLVGEKKNALVVFVVCVSRLLDKPLNLFVKGPSSAGKNFLVRTVLRFLPPETVREITSSSGMSWNYLGKNLKHRIVYLQEESQAGGHVHPARLLISENRLIRMVTRRRRNRFVTEREVTEGPVACISTTTRNRLEVDDETRHLSVWMDDSPEQTRNILVALAQGSDGISAEELETWHEVQNLLEARAKLPIEFPGWFKRVAELVETTEIRARRYFAAFLEACKVVCLIRSFRRKEEELGRREKLRVGFIDFATTILIFADAFGKSLEGPGLEELETRQLVEQISKRKGGALVNASDLAAELGATNNQAYARLRNAAREGYIARVNPPAKGNPKLYRVTPLTRFLPDPARVFKELSPERDGVRFIHPVTGVVLEYRRRPNGRRGKLR